jgi:hypothetical protein
MIYYFDVKETFIKTVGVEADDLCHAEERVEELYHCHEFELKRVYPHDIEFEYVQDEVENCMKQGFITPEEIEVF